MSDDISRCPWAGSDPLYIRYHDDEWGVPKTTDREFFEKIILEGFQSGLSWITILRKREAFRASFDQFDAEQIARYDAPKVAALLNDGGIIRHRGKIEAAIANAQAYLAMRERGENLARFFWDFVDGKPIQNRFARTSDVPPQTALSVADRKRAESARLQVLWSDNHLRADAGDGAGERSSSLMPSA